VVENLKVMNVRNCRSKSLDLNQWRAAAAAAVVVVVVVVVEEYFL
jgi:anti-sigma-K factor RskA